MTYLVHDLCGFVVGTLVAPLLFYLPGLGVVRLILASDSKSGFWQQFGWATILAIAVLPALDVLILRFAGMWAVLIANGAFAFYGLRLLQVGRSQFRIALIFVFPVLLWWLLCAWSYIDVDAGDALYQSIVSFDMVKHAAVVEQIAREGIPFKDPFFTRDGIAGYYHYFYIWPALIRWVSGFTISAAMAFAAASFWTGIAVPFLLWRIAADANFIRPGRGQRVAGLAILLCFVIGTDIIFSALCYMLTGTILPMVEKWNEEVRFLATSVIWVPHHISAVIAGWTGMLLAVRTNDRPGPERGGLILASGLSFCTMFGASLWIALTLSPLLVSWAIVRLLRKDGSLIFSGLIAAAFAVPQFLDLMHGRSFDGTPIAFSVRYFTFILLDDSTTSQIIRAFLLPLNYALEFGLFALGTIIYWRASSPNWREMQPVRMLILASAIVSLLIASFFRSTVIYNDLGWRSILFAQLAAIIWTLRMAQNVRSFHALPRGAAILLILGLTGTVWDFACMRIIRAPAFPVRNWGNSLPKFDYALRGAYEWADAHLPESAVLQHNPTVDTRVLDFGLYGRHWPAVADRDAMLFGASHTDVQQRIRLIMPIFTAALQSKELRRRAQATKIDYILFTARDPIWRTYGGPPPTVNCVYRTSLLCIGSESSRENR